MPTPLITVVTATRTARRLSGCLRTVAEQSYPNIEHLIVVDSNGPLLDQVEVWRRINPKVRAVLVTDVPDDLFINARIGALYNRGFDHARGEMVARVDDDNEIEPEHIASLHALLQDPAPAAAYSWRTMWQRNRQPYLEQRFPWHTWADLRRAKLLYRIWAEAGIVTPGSNIYRDTHDASARGLRFPTVDANEWLWRRQTLDKVRYNEDVSYEEVLYDYSDDFMFVKDFLDLGLTAACNRQPTVRYYLGGHSNDAAEVAG